MLVLSRRLGECVQVGPDIAVKVVEIRHGRVKLAFCAPLSVPIRRTELLTDRDNSTAQRKSPAGGRSGKRNVGEPTLSISRGS